MSEQVVRAVAERTDMDPLELPPLYNAIDPDALDAMFDPLQASVPQWGTLTFYYTDHEITVAYDGEVVIAVKETGVHHEAL